MRIIYLSRSKLENSVNVVYVKGLRQGGVDVVCFYSQGNRINVYVEAFKFLKKEKKSSDVLMVGYESPGFVILSRLVWNKKLVYNALCSVYERMIIARELSPKISFRTFYYWLLDFFAVHFSDLIMVETNKQGRYFKKLFGLSENKIFRAWTGVDEENFFYDSTVRKSDVFTVLFRGALMPESGAEYVIRAAKILENEDIKFIIIGEGILLEKIRENINELKPTNLELITGFVPYETLRTTMQICHLSLGQLSNHERLERTIPHKCYESLAMKLPYLTASNGGILELLTPNETCWTCDPADVKSLAEEILWAKDHPREMGMIAENGYRLYQTKLKSEILAKNLLDRIETI